MPFADVAGPDWSVADENWSCGGIEVAAESSDGTGLDSNWMLLPSGRGRSAHPTMHQ